MIKEDMNMKKLYKSATDKKLCGVCGGIAEYFGIDSTIVRLIMVIVGLASAGTAAIFYLVAAAIMPE